MRHGHRGEATAGRRVALGQPLLAARAREPLADARSSPPRWPSWASRRARTACSSTAIAGEYTQTALAQAVGLDKTTMVVTLDELEAAGPGRAAPGRRATAAPGSSPSPRPASARSPRAGRSSRGSRPRCSPRCRPASASSSSAPSPAWSASGWPSRPPARRPCAAANRAKASSKTVSDAIIPNGTICYGQISY